MDNIFSPRAYCYGRLPWKRENAHPSCWHIWKYFQPWQVKPTGSTSVLTSMSSGIEPLFEYSYNATPAFPIASLTPGEVRKAVEEGKKMSRQIDERRMTRLSPEAKARIFPIEANGLEEYLFEDIIKILIEYRGDHQTMSHLYSMQIMDLFAKFVEEQKIMLDLLAEEAESIEEMLGKVR